MTNELTLNFNPVPDYHIEWGPVLGEPCSVRGLYFDEHGPLLGLTGGGISYTQVGWQSWIEDDYLLLHWCGTFDTAADARASAEAALVEAALCQNREGVRGQYDEVPWSETRLS